MIAISTRSAESNTGALWQALFFAISAGVMLVGAGQLASESNPDRNRAFPIAVLSALWLMTFVIVAVKRFHTAYLFSTAYILCLSVFHLGITLPLGFTLYDADGLESVVPRRWLEQAGWSTALALGSMGIGLVLSFFTSTASAPREMTDCQTAYLSRSIAYWDGLGLLGAALVLFGIGLYSLGDILNYSRADLYRGVGDFRGMGVFMMVFPSAAALLVIGAEGWGKTVFAFTIAVTAILLFMLSGYRSAALFPLLVAVVAWKKTGRGLPAWLAAIGILTILLAIPMIGAFRAMGTYGELGEKHLLKSAEHAKVENTFEELGQTAGILAHVLRLVPDRDPYRYGSTYVMALQQAIPNLMPQSAENRRKEARREASKNPEVIAQMIPSDWLTYRIAPEKFDIGQGVGFSSIAEAYINFGYWGICAYFILLGYVLGKLDSIPLLHNPNVLVFCCAMLWPLMRTVRNDFDNFVKPFAFMLIIVALWRLTTHFVRPRWHNH